MQRNSKLLPITKIQRKVKNIMRIKRSLFKIRHIRKFGLLLLFLQYILLCSGFALNGQSYEFRSCIISSKTFTPPVIDGSLEDSCWSKTIEITPFTLHSYEKRNNITTFAKEQTKVYICNDDKNLYIAFRCDETCLVPRENRAHELIAKETERDTLSFWKDDWVQILLIPDLKNKKSVMYDIAINSNGAINDAICFSENYKGSRNMSMWDSNATVATKKGNGFWTVEMSIPFKSFKIRLKKTKSAGIFLGRQENSRNELSSWCNTNYFHNPKAFATIKFSKKVPGVKLVRLPEFRIGSNILDLKILPYKGCKPIKIDQFVQSQAISSTKNFSTIIQADSKKKVGAPFKLDESKNFKYSWEISLPGSKRFRFKTPKYTLKLQQYLPIKSTISNSNNPIFLNGVPLKNGSYLKKGNNLIAIKATKPLAGSFIAGENSFAIDDSWAFSTDYVQGWQYNNFNDLSWRRPEFKDGAITQKGFLRKTILWKNSTIWPNWEKNGIFINRGGIQQIFFHPQGIKGKKLTGYNFQVEIPDDFSITAISSWRNQKYNIDISGPFTKTHSSQKYKRYSIEFKGPILFKDRPSKFDFCTFIIKAPLKEKYSQNKIFYYAKAEKGNVTEVPRAIKLNMLPSLRGKQPKKMIFQMWLASYGFPNLSRLIASQLVEMGINESIPALRQSKLRKASMVHFDKCGLDFFKYLKCHSNDALIDFSGRKSTSYICSRLFLNHKKMVMEYLNSEVLKFMGRKKYPENVVWDYESNVWKSYISCYCSKCINTFKNHYSLNCKLTPQIIKSKYSSQWIDFMNHKMAAIAKTLRDSIKKISPDSIFSVYSGYQSDYTKHRYGVDWKMLNGSIDLASCGYGRTKKEISDTLTALGATPLLTGEIVLPYIWSSRDDPTFLTKANLMRRICDGNAGILLYAYYSMDGRSFYSIAEISRLVAEKEVFLKDRKNISKNCKITGIPRDAYEFFEYKGKRLLMLMNFSKKEMRFKWKISKNFKITEYYSTNIYSGPIIEDNLPIGDVKAFILEPIN